MENRLIFAERIARTYSITNQEGEHLGYLEKRRVGKWMTWCLFLLEECYVTAGCLDEIREKIKQLNASNILKK